MKYIKYAISVFALIISTSVNASILNTLNGVNYEWLELTETEGLHFATVNQRLADPDDVLYGYENASRQLVEDLLLSYVPWDGIAGHYAAPDVTSGMEQFFTDFGILRTGSASNSAYDTVDGYTIAENTAVSFNESYGVYGSGNECGDAFTKCLSRLFMTYDENGTAISMWINDWDSGFDATNTNPLTIHWTDSATRDIGSYLVRTSVVPVPAAVWLFGSGLIGLVGFSRRKKAYKQN